MSTESARTKAAIAARTTTTEQMLGRVRATLRQMRRDGMPIQPAVVARRAEVSRTFLYQNPQAQQLLAEATTSEVATPATSRPRPAEKPGPWKDRALNAEDTLKAAYTEISNQRGQIALLLGQIRDLEADLPADAVERITTENRALRQQNRTLTTDNQQLTERLKAARENNRFLDTRIARLEADLAEFLLADDQDPQLHPDGHAQHADAEHIKPTRTPIQTHQPPQR
jgi:chromosome segregation ATPase